MTFLGWLGDPFKGLSDLQLGDEKVTLNHLGCVYLPTWMNGKVSKWLVNGIYNNLYLHIWLIFMLMLMGKYTTYNNGSSM